MSTDPIRDELLTAFRELFELFEEINSGDDDAESDFDSHPVIVKARKLLGDHARAEYAATHVSPERLLQAFDEIDAKRRAEELDIMRSRGDL